MGDLVLFGAGASFGSVDVRPEPPPLGPKLLAKLQQAFPRWADLPPPAVQIFASDFEEGMAYLRSNLDEQLPGLLRDMGLYFLQFRPGEKISISYTPRNLPNTTVPPSPRR